MIKKLFTFAACSAAVCGMQAEAPAGYYASCEGKTGKALLQALCDVVGPHTNVGYDGLWEVYEKSDVRDNGTLWDMYSTKEWPRNFKQCGNYKLVGDCVNREHSFPKSWWGGGKKVQYSDAYHLYPTDGKVNGQRSNLPFGECEGGKVLASNGNVRPLGRAGTSTFPGYSGTVFEPDDMYKGDFARTYFYMAAAYNDEIGNWDSPMLAGNNYPAYTTWAVDLLLKWTRQDPVSQKETDRNEAVSGFQHNRNPFIDHPELAEYIWGNKKGVAWYENASMDAIINVPVDGSVIDMGLTSVGMPRTAEIEVKGTALISDMTVAVYGDGFSVSPAKLSANAVNTDGGKLTVTYSSYTAAYGAGTLVLKSGELTTTVTLMCQAVDGLPVGEARNITDSSFTVTWSNIDAPTAKYTLDVRRQGVSIAGYPLQVNASAESHEVTGLEPLTEYTYTLSSPTLTSGEYKVKTLAPEPELSFLYDGELSFSALPGEPSETAEILVYADNIEGNIIIAVDAPFELSTDKQSWSREIEILPEEERFYMRLGAAPEGEYETTITAMADNVLNDDVEVTGTVASTRVDFLEDFEAAKSLSNYEDKTVTGTACEWATNAIFERSGDNAYPHSGAVAARTPKNGGYLEMLSDKTTGIGTLSLYARLWRAETTLSEWDVMVSSDAGQTWETVGHFAVEPNGTNTDYNEYTIAVNRSGALRMKLSQTAGGRTMFDDISMTNHGALSGVSAANAADYHAWDAFCRDGQLVIESDGTPDSICNVYNLEGIPVFTGKLRQGETLLSLPAGLYIAVVGDFSRRILIRK